MEIENENQKCAVDIFEDGTMLVTFEPDPDSWENSFLFNIDQVAQIRRELNRWLEEKSSE